MSGKLRKRLPPILQTLRYGALLEFMIAEQRIDPDVLLLPDSGLLLVDAIVIDLASMPYHITVEEQRIRVLRRNPRDESPTRAGRGSNRLFRIREAHIAIYDKDDRHDRIWVGDGEQIRRPCCRLRSRRLICKRATDPQKCEQ